MTRRRKIALRFSAVFLVLLFGWVTLFLSSNAPTYQGKSIHVWLTCFDSPPDNLSKEEWEAWMQKEADARQAIRQIGPTGFSHLRRMLQPDPSPTKFLGELKRKWDGKSYPKKRGSEETRMLRAVEACSALGSQASVMIPDLLLCLKSNAYLSVRTRAAYALGEIGGSPAEVVPALVDVLISPGKYGAQPNALISLGKYGAQAQAAVPVLVGLLDKADNIALSGADKLIMSESAQALLRIDPREAEKTLLRLRRVLEAETNSWWRSRFSKIIHQIESETLLTSDERKASQPVD